MFKYFINLDPFMCRQCIFLCFPVRSNVNNRSGRNHPVEIPHYPVHESTTHDEMTCLIPPNYLESKGKNPDILIHFSFYFAY